MKRFTLAVALTIVAAMPVSSQPTADGGKNDSAKGSGVGLAFIGGGSGPASFSFNASSDPAGNNPKGTMELKLSDGTYFKATVTCLGILPNPVSDNTAGPQTGFSAVIVGDITDTNATGFPDGLVFVISDSGEPNGQGDRFGARFIHDSTPQGTCTPTSFANPVVSGDITIVDE
jgi:hypothetical protein